MTEENQELDIEHHEREAKKRIRQRRVRGKQVHLKHIHTFCRFLFSCLLIVGTYYFLKLPGWHIAQDVFTHADPTLIKLVNNNIVPDEKVYHLLTTVETDGLPIFAMKTDKIKTLLKSLPPVEDVYIRRYAFPARLTLIFKERIPVITISPDLEAQPVAYFTQDGTLVGHEYAPYITNFSTLYVLSYGNKGDDYHSWKKEQVDNLLSFAKYVEACSKEVVEYIDCRQPNDVYVKLPTVKIRVGKLDAGVNERVQRLSAILPEIKLMDSRIKYLDLRWKDPYLKLE